MSFEEKMYRSMEPINIRLDLVKRQLIDTGEKMREKLYNVFKFMRQQNGDKGKEILQLCILYWVKLYGIELCREK